MGKRLCFFDFVYNLGGGQRSTIDFIANVHSETDEIIIADAHGESKDFRNYATRKGVPLTILRAAKGTAIGKASRWKRILLLLNYLPLYVSTCLALRSFLQVRKIDFVWTNTFKGLAAVSLATVFWPIKTGLFIRAGGMLNNLTFYQKWLLSNCCSEIIVQSALIKSKLIVLGLPSDRISIISNSIEDLSVLKARETLKPVEIKEDCLNVLLPATIIPAKGIEEAILAIRKCKEMFSYPVRLYIAGSDGNFGKNTSPFKQAMEEVIEGYKLENDVVFLGLRDDVISVMQLMDVILLPSYAEGMPRVLMEGMASGKAVIGTAVGAVPELIKNEETGILIRPKDVGAIVNALGVLLDDSIRNAIGGRAKQFIYGNYSVNNQIAQFRSFSMRI